MHASRLTERTPLPLAGRPRRYAPEVEVDLLFDACLDVMARNEHGDVSVTEILSEAGVSTRSFYRHFASKDALISALYRRCSELAFASLAQRIERATSTRQALEAWVDEILSFGYTADRAHRAGLLRSPAVFRASGIEGEMRRTMRRLESHLVAILRDGRRDGTFPKARPGPDAEAICAMSIRAAGLVPGAGVRKTLPTARRMVLSFALRALGATSAA